VTIQDQDIKLVIGLVANGNNLGYWEHWWRAMKLSGALFIHAFLPNVLTDYASKKLSDD
jgi:hypothetical protein